MLYYFQKNARNYLDIRELNYNLGTHIKTLCMQDPQLLVKTLEQEEYHLSKRRKRLNNILIAPYLVVTCAVVAVIYILGYLIAQASKDSPWLIFFIVYGSMFGLGSIFPLGVKLARLFGFPEKEHEEISGKIIKLHERIRNIKALLAIIIDIQEIIPITLPEDQPTLNQHIQFLENALNNNHTQSSSTHDIYLIKKSVTRIKSFLVGNRPSPPKSNPMLNETTPAPATIATITPPPQDSNQQQPSKNTAATKLPTSPPVSKAPATPISKPSPAPKTPTPPPHIEPVPRIAVQMPISAPKKPEKIYEIEPITTEEAEVSTLFSPRSNSIIRKILRRKAAEPVNKKPTNYLEMHMKNQDLGSLGELFILKHEKDYLINNSRPDLSGQVRHISLENDALGYDILSYDLSGVPKYIEIKTTITGYGSQFFLTANEIEKMAQLSNYFIYRVYNFDTNSHTGKIYKINCSKDFEMYFRLEPSIYKVIPNTP